MEAIVELKQRMLFLERAHAAARMGHFVLDPKRMTVEFSSWARENIGFNDMPIPIDRLSEIVAEKEREAFAQTVRNVLAEQVEFEFEINVITAKGMVRTQRVTGIPAFENQRDQSGLIAYFGILQEITRENEARQSLLEARDSARSELRARTNILATVSHEIRTPLGGILGIIDQLKRERDASERERALALIEDSCDVLLDTLDAILQQSRIDQDGENLAIKRFRPSVVVNRVAELFRPLARRKGLRIEVANSTDREAMGDPTRIQQILANYVSNAVKFTQSGTVSILVQEPGETSQEWTFAVSDTGAGMDEKRVKSIFEPFGESSADSLGRSGGAGLGLSITRDLVDAMQGRIEVESAVGKGSTFKIFLPLEAVEKRDDEQKGNTSIGQAVVMIDRASDVVQAEAIFSQFGYKISTLDGLKEALVGPKVPLAIFVDAARLNEIPNDLKQECGLVIGLANAEEAHSLSEALGADVSMVASNNLARSLKDLLGSETS